MESPDGDVTVVARWLGVAPRRWRLNEKQTHGNLWRTIFLYLNWHHHHHHRHRSEKKVFFTNTRTDINIYFVS